MPLVKSNLQKLENLLKSATNARQRKMYQSLLDKALKDAEHQELVSVQKAKTDTTTVVASPVKDKQQERSTKKVKKDKIEVSELKTSKQGNSKKSSVEQPEEVALQQDNNTKKSNKQTQGKKSPFFQAVGLIRCIPHLKDDKLYITVDGEEFELRRGKWGTRQNFDNLKLEAKQNGSKEICLRVYPKIAHNQKKQKICQWFVLTRVFSENSQTQNRQEDFILRGIWHQVSYCSQPVISIYRNIEMLQYYKQTKTPAGKKAFARPQDFPVVWSAPVEPFKYNSKLKKDQQMPRYFVQVRAVFEDGQFHVTEMIQEPTLDIPQYIKPQKKRVNNQKS